MNIKNIAIGSTAVGAATLGTALALQFAYKKFDYYPPNPVFYFASGALAFTVMELLGVHNKLKELTA